MFSATLSSVLHHVLNSMSVIKLTHYSLTSPIPTSEASHVRQLGLPKENDLASPTWYALYLSENITSHGLPVAEVDEVPGHSRH